MVTHNILDSIIIFKYCGRVSRNPPSVLGDIRLCDLPDLSILFGLAPGKGARFIPNLSLFGFRLIRKLTLLQVLSEYP